MKLRAWKESFYQLGRYFHMPENWDLLTTNAIYTSCWLWNFGPRKKYILAWDEWVNRSNIGCSDRHNKALEPWWAHFSAPHLGSFIGSIKCKVHKWFLMLLALLKAKILMARISSKCTASCNKHFSELFLIAAQCMYWFCPLVVTENANSLQNFPRLFFGGGSGIRKGR